MRPQTRIAFGCFLLSLAFLSGCFLWEWELEVRNETSWDLTVYSDGERLGTVPAYGRRSFDLSEGTHRLEARVGYVVIASRTEDVDQDIIWAIGP